MIDDTWRVEILLWDDVCKEQNLRDSYSMKPMIIVSSHDRDDANGYLVRDQETGFCGFMLQFFYVCNSGKFDLGCAEFLGGLMGF